jgi:hypothetical protein
MDYVNTSLATVDAELDEIAAIGADYVRSDLLDNTQYRDRFEYVLSGCEARGLQMEACMRGTSGPMADPATAAATASSFYSQFGNRVWGYSWVNEPNLYPSSSPRYTPAQYAAELAAVYDALKALDSSVLVGGGVMGWDAAGAFSAWWPGVLSNGGSGKFDFWDIHLYDDPSGTQWTEAFALDFEGKPVVATEAGSDSGTMATRQSVITNAMNDSRLASVCIYSMRELGDGFGLLDSGGTRLPSWTTYHDIATAPGGALMKNFEEGVDLLVNVGLDGLPAANTLYAWLCDQNEAAAAVTDTRAGDTLTQTAGTAVKTIGSLTSSARIVDLGAIDWSTETSGTPKSIVVTTKTKSDAAGKYLAIVDINGGATVDLSSGYVCDGLSFKILYDGE